jgi:folate-dependent phosphoribosylglycinamide formyltransferase PurN
MIKPFFDSPERRIRTAILLSGGGSNAEALLRYEKEHALCPYETVLIFTDAPESSKAEALADEYGLPFAYNDLRKFYASRGEESISLDSPRRRQLRDEWSEEIWSELQRNGIELVLLAGFIPLTNLAAKVPCLNVHPGDLTVVDEQNRRILAGLHYLPVERAILDGHKSLRSSVIIVQPYEENGKKDMDSGPVIGISRAVEINLEGETISTLSAVKDSRNHAPYNDRLRSIAHNNIESLKISGDHVVFPRAAADFAAGFFAADESGSLFYRNKQMKQWRKVVTVEYSSLEAEAKPIIAE